jgi:hypothetical protein
MELDLCSVLKCKVYLLCDVLEFRSWYIFSFIPTVLSVPFTNYLPSTTRFIKRAFE